MLGKRVTPSLADVLTGKVDLTDALYEARENLYVIPSDSNLDHVSTYLKDHHRAYSTLRRSLDQLEGRVDFVLFDQAGAFSPIMDALLIASDEMLIPCELEPYAIHGLFDMFNKLKHELLYVCTFRKGGSRKEHHVVSRVRITNLVATEVSDACPHYMPG